MLKKEDTDRIKVFGMWAYPRIMRLSRVSETSNKELRRSGQETEIGNTIKLRKLLYLGQVIRGGTRCYRRGKMRAKISIGR